MSQQTGESAYLFRHAILREAAYELQTPALRGILHRAAADLTETLFDVKQPSPFSSELAAHLRFARVNNDEQGDLQREQKHTRMAAEWAEALYRNEDAIREWLELASITSGEDRRYALHKAGEASLHIGRFARAESLFEQCVQLAAEAQNLEGEALGLMGLGVTATRRGQFDAAEELLERALELRQQLGDEKGQAEVLTRIATVRMDRGQLPDAEDAYRRALPIARDSSVKEYASILGNLGNVVMRLGRPLEAQQLLDEALELIRGKGYRKLEAPTLGVMAVLHMQLNRTDSAERYFHESVAAARATGNRRAEANAETNLANLRATQERDDEVEVLLTRNLEMLREIGDRYSEAICLANTGNLYIKTQRFDLAQIVLDKAIQLSREIKTVRAEAAALSSKAKLLRSQGNPEGARPIYAEAIARFRECSEAFFTAITRCELAMANLEAGHRNAAMVPWQEGMKGLADYGDDHSVQGYMGLMRAACAEADMEELPDPTIE